MSNEADQSRKFIGIEQISLFAKQLELKYMGAQTQLEVFDSGAIMLDVSWQNRLFILAYSPKNGFFVDEVLDDDYFGMGYQFHANNFDQAIEEIDRLIISSK
jgi:hypothetical protein